MRLFESKFGTADHMSLNFAGALIDLRDLCISEITLDGQFLAVTDSSVDLDGRVRAEHGGFGSEKFGNRGLEGKAFPCFFRAFLCHSRVVNEQAGGLDAGFHVRNLEACALELADLVAKGFHPSTYTLHGSAEFDVTAGAPGTQHYDAQVEWVAHVMFSKIGLKFVDTYDSNGWTVADPHS